MSFNYKSGWHVDVQPVFQSFYVCKNLEENASSIFGTLVVGNFQCE